MPGIRSRGPSIVRPAKDEDPAGRQISDKEIALSIALARANRALDGASHLGAFHHLAGNLFLRVAPCPAGRATRAGSFAVDAVVRIVAAIVANVAGVAASHAECQAGQKNA
jgi:cyanate permease